MAILVTGGTGYIGSHASVELLNAGYDLIIIDNLRNSNIESLRRIETITGKKPIFYKVDLLDREGLENIFSNHYIDGVIHFAGLKAVGESVVAPVQYYHNNITGTLVLCDVMKMYNVKNLVFSSSATVYGIPKDVPISEDSIVNAMNPYGKTKQIVEEFLRDLYISDNAWSISLLRYFNPIGAHESGQLGEAPKGIPNNLMPYISQVAAGRLEMVQIFGNDYPTIDGTGVRDYIHVVDLAVGHLKALEKVMESKGIEAYNLGTGKGYSVLQVIRAFEEASGKKIPYQIIDRRPGDVAICYADTYKARTVLGWKSVRGIAEMCKDSWKWQQKNPNGYEIEESKVEV